MLKKKVRKKWENEHLDYELTYVWGMDMDERGRAERLEEAFPEFHHEFPLIDKCFTKDECHGLAARLGLKRPVMYDMGYPNNNCVGCVKGGMILLTKLSKISEKISLMSLKKEQRWSGISDTAY